MIAPRVLDVFATNRWIDDLRLPRVAKTALRCLVSKVDNRTGASHPRFPITQAAISRAISYSISQLCVGLGAIESLGLVRRRQMPPRRRADGKIRQDATDYELTLPDLCWRFLLAVERSFAARPVAPTSLDVPWSLTVQGKLSTQDATTHRRPRVPRSWNLDPSQPTTFIDDMHYDKLAPKLLDGAMLAAEGVDESLRHRTMVCLNALRERALDVALLACNLDISSWDAINCVKHWVVRCVTNPAQHVDSAEHAINILRRFFLEQQRWAHRKAAERIRERTRAKYQALDDDREDAAREVEQERGRAARAHIAVGHDKFDESAFDGVDVDIFG